MNDATASAVAVVEAVAESPADLTQHKDLCDGKRVTLRAAEAAVAALGEGWRLETPHEAFAQIDYGHKNAHGAVSRDQDRTPDPYWTCQPWPLDPAARVLVWFGVGIVSTTFDVNRARARAVRVAGQCSDL